MVTAPRNETMGVVPAVLHYYLDHLSSTSPNYKENFLLTASAIRGLIKSNARIRGAEVGCEAAASDASAVAAAGLCSVMGS